MLCIWPCILDDNNEVNDFDCVTCVLRALIKFFPYVSLSTILFCVPPRMLVMNVILSRQDSEKKKLVWITCFFFNFFYGYDTYTHALPSPRSEEIDVSSWLVTCKRRYAVNRWVWRRHPIRRQFQIKTGWRLAILFISGGSGSRACQVSNYYYCLLYIRNNIKWRHGCFLSVQFRRMKVRLFFILARQVEDETVVCLRNQSGYQVTGH